MNENVEKRFEEVRCAYTLNRIGNLINRKKYKNIVTILKCYIATLDKDYEEIFDDIFKRSINEQILGADKKEIYAAFKTKYKKKQKIIEKLGISSYTFSKVYGDIVNRNFMTDDWLMWVGPRCDQKEIEVCKHISAFLDNFNYIGGDEYYKYYDHFRIMELEIYSIYTALINICLSEKVVELVVQRICYSNDIDYSSVNFILSNMHKVTRTDGIQINGNTQVKKEIFNLAYLKGLKKGDVAEIFFKKPRNSFSSGSYNYITEDITNDEYVFSIVFCPTLEWEYIEKEAILQFIDSFRGLSNERL